ncbi:MAG TPA: hypothetical protein VGR45_17325 [Stellaceae bacterium]|nr:hypothetical protein [Stellaceae bacterium]
MADDISEARARVIAEAKSWIGTPYHHMGRVKGAGCDCLTLLVEVYQRAGVIGPVEFPFYPPDAMMHRDGESYFEGILAHGHEVEKPEPGDAVLFRWGRIYGHGGIVLEWPEDPTKPAWIINADPHNGVRRADARNGDLIGRETKFVSPF